MKLGWRTKWQRAQHKDLLDSFLANVFTSALNLSKFLQLPFPESTLELHPYFSSPRRSFLQYLEMLYLRQTPAFLLVWLCGQIPHSNLKYKLHQNLDSCGQHQKFPNSLPSKYYPGLMVSIWMATGEYVNILVSIGDSSLRHFRKNSVVEDFFVREMAIQSKVLAPSGHCT